MSVCYIFAVTYKLNQNISQELIDTLKYMTRSQEYDFVPPKHPLFEDDYDKTIIWDDGTVIRLRPSWRGLIANEHRGGEEDFWGEFFSGFQDLILTFRRLVRDDDLFNVWYVLGPLLASVSESDGFVGYYLGDVLRPSSKLTLIYFENGYVFECPVTPIQEWQSKNLNLEEVDKFINLDLEAFPDQIKRALDYQAKGYFHSTAEYLKSVIIEKQLNIPIEIQESWSWIE